jgi:hypothetical protein
MNFGPLDLRQFVKYKGIYQRFSQEQKLSSGEN